MSAANASSQKNPSLISFFITILLGLGVFTYLAFSIYARDALWFWPKFEEIPSGIYVRCYGEVVKVKAGSPEFVEITRLVNTQLSGDKQWQDITISDQTFQDYLSDPSMVVLELDYSTPVDVHTGTAMFMDIETLLTPLVGRFSKENIILGAVDLKFTGGRIHVQNTQPLKDYVNQAGICTIK